MRREHRDKKTKSRITNHKFSNEEQTTNEINDIISHENVKDYSAKKKIMTKLDKKRDSAMRDALSDEHYVYYVKLQDQDPAAMKATKACREGQEIW